MRMQADTSGSADEQSASATFVPPKKRGRKALKEAIAARKDDETYDGREVDMSAYKPATQKPLEKPSTPPLSTPTPAPPAEVILKGLRSCQRSRHTFEWMYEDRNAHVVMFSGLLCRDAEQPSATSHGLLLIVPGLDSCRNHRPRSRWRMTWIGRRRGLRLRGCSSRAKPLPTRRCEHPFSAILPQPANQCLQMI